MIIKVFGIFRRLFYVHFLPVSLLATTVGCGHNTIKFLLAENEK